MKFIKISNILIQLALIFLVFKCADEQNQPNSLNNGQDTTNTPTGGHTNDPPQNNGNCPSPIGSNQTTYKMSITYGSAMSDTIAGLIINNDGKYITSKNKKICWYDTKGILTKEINGNIGKIRDLAGNANGTIAAVGDSGVLSTDATGNILWSIARIVGDFPGTGSKVSIAEDGRVVALGRAGKITLFSSTGEVLTSITQNNSCNDIAISSEAQLILTCGFTQLTSILQIPWIHAYNFSGARVWTNYNQTADGLGSDSRCNSMCISKDKRIYMVGEQAGGTSPFGRDPKDITKSVANGGIAADKFQNAYNLNGAAHIGYIGIYDLQSGNRITGTNLLARLDNTKGNTCKLQTICTDSKNYLYIGGTSASSIANKDSLRIDNQAMPGSGNFVVAFSPQLCRLLWVTIASGGSIMSMTYNNGLLGVITSNSTSAVIKNGTTSTSGMYLGLFPL